MPNNSAVRLTLPSQRCRARRMCTRSACATINCKGAISSLSWHEPELCRGVSSSSSSRMPDKSGIGHSPGGSGNGGVRQTGGLQSALPPRNLSCPPPPENLLVLCPLPRPVHAAPAEPWNPGLQAPPCSKVSPIQCWVNPSQQVHALFQRQPAAVPLQISREQRRQWTQQQAAKSSHSSC